MRPRRHYNKTFFSVPTLENCYWAGFLAADGYVSVSSNRVELYLANKDRAHVEAFKRVIKYDGSVRDKPKVNACGITLHSAEQWIYDLENNFNVVPRKSLILKPPDGLMHWGIDYEKAYLVGYIDGDGCIRYDNRDGLLNMSLFSGSERIVVWAKRFIERELRIPAKRIAKLPNGRGFDYKLSGSHAEHLLAQLVNTYEHQLKRKWAPERPTVFKYRDRSKGLNTDNFCIVSVHPGFGKYRRSAVFVCKTFEGAEFRVRMRGEPAALEQYFEDPALAIGRALTVKYWGLTNKNGVPRFPVAVRFREDA